ncbi:hypothetical protein [Promicromonospora sp. NFX87]|uniref:hypothetical protein n=1 Tax=Promicromonospora sp. NFX87 TaxID=3402691 RepID=UPI003AFAE919
MTQQWIGRQFVTRSKHPEEAGRTIQVLKQKTPAASLSFVVQNVAHPANPSLVGRESTVSAKTLNSAWLPVETPAGPGGGTSFVSLDELLAKIQAEHDQEHPDEHAGCHTLVLLAGIRAALIACDKASTGSIAPAAIREAIASGIRAS